MPGWFLWIGLAIAWFTTIQAYPLLDPDEGRYAEIPREMAASGDWVTPRLDGLMYMEKPPLQYWVTAALYKTFGVSEWTARTWALTFSFLCLPLTFMWVRRLYGAEAAFASLAVLGTSPLFVAIGHLNILDGAFTFWLTSALLSFTLAQVAAPGSQPERNWMLAAWLAAAVAVLSKGIVVLVLAGVSLAAYSIVQRDHRVWRRLHLAAGLPLFLMVCAPWFIVISLRNPAFPAFFFLHEHFARFLTTVHQRVEPWWYFLAVAALALLPWIGELPAALRHAWNRSPPDNSFRPLRFLLIYSSVTLIFFSASQSKLASYVLPIMPAIAAAMGSKLSERAASIRRASWITAALAGIGSLGLVISLTRAPGGLQWQSAVWAVIAVVVAVVAAFAVRKGRTVAHNTLILVVASTLVWPCLMAALAPSRSARDLTDKIRPELPAKAGLYSVGQYRQSAPVYLGRTMTLVNFTGELEFGLQQEPGRNSLSLDEFTRRWQDETEAVAFVQHDMWEQLARTGMPGRVLAADRYTTVVKRR